jgi:hypothetical protein
LTGQVDAILEALWAFERRAGLHQLLGLLAARR